MLRLSFVYHMISMVVSLFATFYLLYILLFSNNKLQSHQVVTLLLLLATSLATQSLLNFSEEYIYDFYPLSGKTTIGTEPVNRSQSTPSTTPSLREKILGIF
jgi:hypothetical protein